MSSATAVQTRIWRMPIVLENYERSPLTEHEKTMLATAARLRGHARGINGLHYAKRELMRFQTPIFDVIALRTHDMNKYRNIRKLLYREMVQRGTSFWEWSKREWIEIICPTYQDYLKKYGPLGARQSLMDIAYFLGEITDLREVDQERECTETAQYIFSAEVIEHELRKITDVLVGQKGRGYSESWATIKLLRQALSLLFLWNRNPYLENLSREFMQTTLQEASSWRPRDNSMRASIKKIFVALQELGLLERQESKTISTTHEACIDTTGVPEEWVEWNMAWLKRQPKVTSRLRSYYNLILGVGRWLVATYPGIVSPEQWDEDIALEYVRYVCTTATTGDYTSAAGMKRLSDKGMVGKPLAPRTMNHKLAAMRCFFTDLQRRPHTVGSIPPHKIEEHFNPNETFATPRSIHQLIQPDPRDINEISWCKLTYAAATLTEEDYALVWSGYPLSYYQAAALLWVTSARRPNEIARLQVGCIRRDWDPAMLDENGLPIPGQEAQLCYLHIPSNKTKGPYWIPIPKYTADAVEIWEKERPVNQPQLLDSKDNALVDFLFCMRGKRMGGNFLNHSLIPVLCKRAGVPEKDARGTITGHRARSTIATMLRKNGVSLDDISQFLGHANPEMVKAYARTDPFRFGRDMNRANDLMRIVEGIIDTRAAKAGKPNVFFFLGRGSDGQPRFCGNPAWDKCRHRLACLKCPMYVGASQASRLAERLETRDEIFKFQTQVEMTPQEKAASEGDIQALTEFIEADKDVPPPAVPGNDFQFNPVLQGNAETSPPDSQTDLVALGRKLAALNRDLAVAEKRTDGRNASIRSLKKQIAHVSEQMADLDQINVITRAGLEA